MLSCVAAWGCGSGPDRRAERAEADYSAAEQALDRGDLQAARGRFEALARTPDPQLRALALYRRAVIAEKQGRAEAARRLFAEVEATAATERAALAAYRNALAAEGDADLKALVDRWPDSVAADKAVKHLAARGEVPTTLAWLEAAAIRHDARSVADNARWWAARVRLYRLGDLPGARAALTALVRRWPDGPLSDDALWLLAQLQRRQGEWADAVTTLQALVTLRDETSYLVGSYRSPWLDDAALLIAEIRYHALGDVPGAIAAYRRFVRDYPDSVLTDDALWGLLHAQRAAGEGGRASATAARLLERFPDSRHAQAVRARAPRPPDPRAVAPTRLGELTQ